MMMQLMFARYFCGDIRLPVCFSDNNAFGSGFPFLKMGNHSPLIYGKLTDIHIHVSDTGHYC